MNCEHCDIETEGARDEDGRTWPICGECLRELLDGLRELLDDEVRGRERLDPLIEDIREVLR